MYGADEVVTDQLATHFPAAVDSFLKNPPATMFAASGIKMVGRGVSDKQVCRVHGAFCFMQGKFQHAKL